MKISILAIKDSGPTYRSTPIRVPAKHRRTRIPGPVRNFVALIIDTHSPRRLFVSFGETAEPHNIRFRDSGNDSIHAHDLTPHSLRNSSSSSIFSNILTRRSLLARASSFRSPLPRAMYRSESNNTAQSPAGARTPHVGYISSRHVGPIV
jgi:hypothetical protein